jgi:hypothetical protein
MFRIQEGCNNELVMMALMVVGYSTLIEFKKTIVKTANGKQDVT